MSSSGPAVAVIGYRGFIGQMVMPIAFEAVKEKRIRELRILSRKFDPDALKGILAAGATTQNASYNSIASLTQALAGIDVVINMMGLQGDDWIANKDNLLEAISKSNVKVYIPSEFGTNHYITKYPDNATFQPKAHHLKKARAKCPKVVPIFTSLIMETAFIKWLGFDNEKEEWNIVGDGNVPVSLTAKEDVGKFTIEAAITAYNEPNKIPDGLSIYSCTHTLQEYAAILDKYAKSGNKTKLNKESLEKAKADWEVKKHTIPMGMIGPLLLIMMAEGHFDHSVDKADEILNAGQSKWKLQTFEDYAQREHGRPWVGKQPFGG